MDSPKRDRFVKVPTELLDAFLQTQLTDVQWRVILWIIRQTFGWNRLWVQFSWYGIAKELQCDRSVVYRAGQRLLQRGLIVLQCRKLTLQSSALVSAQCLAASKSVAAEERWITSDRAIQEQGKSLLPDNEGVVRKQRFSVERKTGVKTIQKRRRAGGYVDNPRPAEDDAVRDLLMFYGAFKAEGLSSDEAARLLPSARALLTACSGNLLEAKTLLQKSLEKPGP